MIHRVEIAVWNISLERLRLEREQILLELTSDTSFTLEKLFLKLAERAFLGREAALLATKSR